LRFSIRGGRLRSNRRASRDSGSCDALHDAARGRAEPPTLTSAARYVGRTREAEVVLRSTYKAFNARILLTPRCKRFALDLRQRRRAHVE